MTSRHFCFLFLSVAKIWTVECYPIDEHLEAGPKQQQWKILNRAVASFRELVFSDCVSARCVLSSAFLHSSEYHHPEKSGETRALENKSSGRPNPWCSELQFRVWFRYSLARIIVFFSYLRCACGVYKAGTVKPTFQNWRNRRILKFFPCRLLIFDIFSYIFSSKTGLPPHSPRCTFLSERALFTLQGPGLKNSVIPDLGSNHIYM